MRLGLPLPDKTDKASEEAARQDASKGAELSAADMADAFQRGSAEVREKKKRKVQQQPEPVQHGQGHRGRAAAGGAKPKG